MMILGVKRVLRWHRGFSMSEVQYTFA